MLSKFDPPQLADKQVSVGGPLTFAQGEPATTVLSLHFVLVQGNCVVHGAGETSGDGRWDGEQAQGDLVAGPAQAFGMAVLMRKAQGGTPPAVQTFDWCEAVTIDD
jgi:hypothetical protein